MRRAIIATALLATITTADARPKAHAHRQSYDLGTILPHPAGCPRRAFCGCGVAVRVFGRPDKSLWRAAAWYRFPRTSPRAGAVAVWNHHVAFIESVAANGAILYDPNSGHHLTRRHVGSLSGATIVDPNGNLAYAVSNRASSSRHRRLRYSNPLRRYGYGERSGSMVAYPNFGA